MPYREVAIEGDGFNPIWLLIVAVCLITAAAIYFNSSSLGIPCSYNPCELQATTYMESPAGTVGAFCDVHSAEMYANGWVIRKWK